jgi:pteridine reductase
MPDSNERSDARAPKGATMSQTTHAVAGSPSPDRADANPSRAMPPLAVITGAARRVGRAIALEFARQGFDLVLTYRRSREACEATAREVVAAAADAGHGGRAARTVELDLADAASLARATAAIDAIVAARAGGALDALVHNASDYEASPFGALDAAALERQHRTEVVGPCLLTQSLAPALARSTREGGAAVVLFGDLHSVGRPRPGYAAYTLAKAGARMLAEQLAVELAPATRVHCVAPSVVMLPDGFPEEMRERILARTPLGRLGTPEECARLVRFLVCEATFLTGETIRIDGGRGLR